MQPRTLQRPVSATLKAPNIVTCKRKTGELTPGGFQGTGSWKSSQKIHDMIVFNPHITVRLGKHEKQIKMIFEAIKQLIHV
jgi:hypothetical protein